MTRCLLILWVVVLGMFLPAGVAAQPAPPKPLPAPGQVPPQVPPPYIAPPQLPPPQPFFPALLPLFLMPLWFLLFLLVQFQLKRAWQEQYAEEEDQTKYVEEDLMQDWEFKIIRNPLNRFDCREYLQQVLQEEAQAGWQLVEKFDGRRVRLKRLTSQRAGDANLPPEYDPYRTTVGPKVTALHISCFFCWILFGVCALLLLVSPLIQRVDPMSPEAFRTLLWALGAGAILFGALALGLTRRARRAEKKPSLSRPG
jgi:hypothetical protein